jgi:signal transduction histidine kinase
MKLRRKLIVLQLVVMVIVGFATAVWMALFVTRSMPLMEHGIRTETRSCLLAVQREVRFALAAADREALLESLARCSIRPDQDAAVFVRDLRGQVLASIGKIGSRPLPTFPHAPRAKPTVLRRDREFWAVAVVKFEGKPLGTLWARFSAAKVHQWQQTITGLAIGALLLVMFAGWASVRYALRFTQPLRAMISYVHDVAAGRLERRLDVTATDELGELASDLNKMTKRLHESRRELSDISHQAGMAKVASSVLHNVGNTLNSVGVCVDVITSTAKESKVPTLEKLAELIKAHEHDIEHFVRDDPKGSRFPEFLKVLAERIAHERGLFLRESDSLRRHVEHIAAIVATQQKLSHRSSSIERVDLDEIISTALDMVGETLKKHAITVQRDIDELGMLALDRHALLQILVNLFSNALDSLKVIDRRRELSIFAQAVDETSFVIGVADNGVGIISEHQQLVFQHGFTTKKTGHGFGLHSCANQAATMGGSLICESAGEDKGATFLLTLPLAREIGYVELASGDTEHREQASDRDG